MIAKLTHWWRAVSRWERVVWCLVALCLLGAATVKPLVRWVSPQLAVRLWWEASNKHEVLAVVEVYWGLYADVEDPWGNELPHDRPDQPWRSLGPNEKDEFGRGDDIVFDDQDWSDNPPPAWVQILAHLVPYTYRQLLFPALIVWIAAARSLKGKPRSPQVTREFLRAAVLSSAPAVLTTAALLETFYRIKALQSLWHSYEDAFGLTDGNTTRWPHSLQVVGVGLCFLLALWWRLSRTLEGEESAEATGG